MSQKKFKELELAPFHNDHRKKVLLVGDSYAQDLLNVAFAAGLDERYDFSTKQINAECGNLYLKEDISSFVPANLQARCVVLGRYEREDVQNLLRESDELWIVGAWSQWVAERLPQSGTIYNRIIQQKSGFSGVRISVKWMTPLPFHSGK